MRFIIVFTFLSLIFFSCSRSYLENKEKNYNKYAAYSIKRYNENLQDYRDRMHEIRIKDGDTICDIGGGNGHSSSIFATLYPNAFFFEEDISYRCNKKRFKRTFDMLNPSININNFRFVRGTETKIPFIDKSFKFVTIVISIHEFSNKDLMLQEVNRIMRDDGYLYIHETVYKNQPTIDSSCKINLLSEKELYSIIERNGFKITPDSSLGKHDSTYNTVGRFLECKKKIITEMDLID